MPVASCVCFFALFNFYACREIKPHLHSHEFSLLSNVLDSWNKRSQNLHKKAHLLTKSELRARGITRYDAEMVLAQGYSLPESRPPRRILRDTKTSVAGSTSVTSSSGDCKSTKSSSTPACDSSSSNSSCSPGAITSTSNDLIQQSKTTRNKHVKHKRNQAQAVPKLKLRLSRLSDTETDSSVTGGDTPQPLYEILGNEGEIGSNRMSQESLHLDDDTNSQSTIFSQDENCSQSSLEDFNDQDFTAFSPHKNLKRMRLKFDGEVVINYDLSKT